MHIPDGFLSPQTFLPAYALAAACWWWASRGLRRQLDDRLVPRLAAMTALAYGLGLILVPIPGGTSGHVLGVAMLALLFGVRLAFLSHSLVLLLQSLFFGAGGITALPVNALAMGLAGGVCAVAVFRLLRHLNEPLAVALATWCSVMLSALLVGTVLGLQPLVARHADGTPAFFPFGLHIVLPALLVPHALVGFGEAMLTLLLWRFAQRRRWLPQADRAQAGAGRARAWLLLYLLSLTAAAFVQSPAVLAAAGALAVLAAGAQRWRLLRRTVAAVLVFNLSVSLAQAVMAGLPWTGAQAGQAWSHLLLMNLRVLLMVFLGFWFVARVNLVAALSFSPALGFLATLAIGQILVFSRLHRDFRLAFISRHPVAPGWRSRLRHAGAHAACLLDKSVASAEETSMAMRSRGCFDD